MKYSMLAILTISALAFHATAGVPTAVVSTSDKIQIFNPQNDALDFNKLCDLIAQDSIEIGKKSSLSCTKHPNDIVELIGSNNLGTLSIFANATDKTVIEYMGSDITHRYTNNLNQSMNMQLSFVNEGVGRTRTGEALEKGHYRGDIYLFNEKSRIRVGYYIQEFTP